jgi:transposase
MKQASLQDHARGFAECGSARPRSLKEAHMKTIGIDTHARVHAVCVLGESGKREQEFTVKGDAAELVRRLCSRVEGPFQVCYEASLTYGLLHEALAPVAARVVVAHPARLRAIACARQKNDRLDAARLARYLLLEEVPAIHVPSRDVREWRGLIEHRTGLVEDRAANKASLRALLRANGIQPPRGFGLWTRAGVAWLKGAGFGSPLSAARRDHTLRQIESLTGSIRACEELLDAIAARDPRTALLRTIRGVGPRTAEAMVAWVDRPERFARTRRAASYFGLVPALDESAAVKRYGRITKEGPATARKLLVEASWRVVALEPSFRAHFERIKAGRQDRAGKAIVAVARRLVMVMIAMLKSGEAYRPPVQERSAADQVA